MKTFRVHMEAHDGGKIREVNVPDKDLSGEALHDLERIFYWGQNDFQPKPICSVSVGDVAEYGGKLYMVMGMGWKEISTADFEKYQKMENKFNFVYEFNKEP